LVAVLFVAMLLLVGGVAGAIYWKMDQTLEEVSDPTLGGINPIEQVDTTYHADKPISMVILGRDTRPKLGTMNTDVMIVAVANPQTKKVTMVSLPRDTRVKIPGYRGYRKINEVYADGEAERRQAERNGQPVTENGITLVKKTLNEVLGIPIDHYVVIDFEGFKSVIDELGGVEINVDRRLYYNDPTDGTHIDLKPGRQLLNGDQALDYVRHRKDSNGNDSSDFDRSRRQQEVIKAVVDKMTSLEALPKIFSVMEVGGEHIRTSLSADQIKGLALDFKGINSSSIVALDNGAYWKYPYTYLPKENLDAIRQTLRSEMSLTDSMIAELNDSPIYSGGEETATAARPPQKKKSRESAAQAAPAPAKPKQETTETPEQIQQPPAAEQPGQENPEDPGNVQNPADQQGGEGTTPPESSQQPPVTGETPPADGSNQLPPDIPVVPAPQQIPQPEGQTGTNS
jgi:LCP family protein required for cell wall assembly